MKIEEKDPEPNPEPRRLSILDTLESADEWEEQETKWIIPNVIPRGAITLVSARESSGKSTLLSQTCVDLALGRPTLFDDPNAFEGREPLKAVYIDAEEGKEARNRMLKMGGKTAKGRLMTLSKRSDDKQKNKELQTIVATLTTDSDAMRELIEGYRPDILVLAPVSAFLPPKCKATSKKDVVQALRPLADLAEEFDCAIVLLQHTNKAICSDYRKCISDSSYFSECPRSVIMMGRTANEDEFFASVEKGSLTSIYDKYQTRLLRFRRDIQAFDCIGTTPKKWRDFVLQALGKDNFEIDNARIKAQRKSQRQENMDIIMQVLKDNGGSMERGELLPAIAEAGATDGSREQAIKALKDMGIIITMDVPNGKSRTTTYKIAKQNDSFADE